MMSHKTLHHFCLNLLCWQCMRNACFLQLTQWLDQFTLVVEELVKYCGFDEAFTLKGPDLSMKPMRGAVS